MTADTLSAEAVERVQKRIAEIEAHTAKYPSWIGGTTWQHAEDLKAILAKLGGRG